MGMAASGGLRALLWTQREAYWTDLAAHIGRHLAPFAAVAAGLPAAPAADRGKETA
jgi:hypothetical protein